MARELRLARFPVLTSLVVTLPVATFLLLTATTPSLALDPRRAITQYSHTAWETDNGLPQNTVRAVAQTPDGYLWIGTQAGLVRFDGTQMQIFDASNTRELANQHIYSLASDAAGNLWIGTNGGGLVHYRDGKMQRYGVDDGLPANRITALEPAADGSLWIGTYGGGLARFADGQFDVFGRSEGLPHDVIFDLALEPEGALWIATYGGGVSRLDQDELSTFTTAEGLLDNGAWAVTPARAGGVWIGTNLGLQRLRADGRFETFDTRHGLSHARVITLLEDRDGVLWAGTYGGGLSRYANGTFSALTPDDGLSDATIWTLFEDREGSLWAGTLGGGVNQLTDGPFVTLSSAEGLPSQLPAVVMEDPDGSLWIGFRDLGLCRMTSPSDTRCAEHWNLDNGLSSNAVFTLQRDQNGDLWAGTTGSGLNRLHDGQWTVYTTADGLSDNTVFALAEDRRGDLWVGTNNGLDRYRDGTFTRFSTEDGLIGNQIRMILEGRQGGLWIGTTHGMSHFDGTRFTSFGSAQGLSDNNIQAIHEDEDGTVWIATSGGGLNRLQDGEITTYNTSRGLFDNDLYTILEDSFAHLWLGTSRGVVRVSRKHLNAFADGRINAIPQTIFGNRDGMKNAVCYGGDRSGTRTRDGRLWFATLDGVVSVDPARIEVTQAPEVLLENVRVDDVSQSLDLGTLPNGARYYEFRFAAPNLRARGVRLRYRLDGLDTAWRDAGTQRFASYTNLRPGSYIFEVMASDSEGAWTGNVTSFAFTIEPFFYQTRLFPILCLATLFLGALTLHTLRIRQHKRREHLLADRVDEAMARIKVLRGFLPICAGCKKIRDDGGAWQELEVYIDQRSEASFSHGICPQCAEQYLDRAGQER